MTLGRGRCSQRSTHCCKAVTICRSSRALRKLYLPHSTDSRVVVIDTKTNKITKIIPVKGGPVGVAFAPNGEVWLSEDGDGSITIVDSKTDEVVKVIATSGKGESRVALSPDGRFAAATHNDTRDVMIIDSQTKQIVATVAVGGGSLFPLFSPDGTKVYVDNGAETRLRAKPRLIRRAVPATTMSASST